ncbi:MAG: hypothetical protein EKK52_18785 [Burkholderiales bacterium]|uniref:DDE-type integrase/transposase/recombinase n=1 Tax=Roseateles sp. TaxID=1971397 RepID=UPI000FB601DD|nr:MAG: hypothetical protein EKK52_18785 [Burkholderiales bacterium]
MMTEEQLNEYLESRGVTAAGAAYIRRVRASDPSRAVGSSARNVTCRFASRKMGRTIQAESRTCELPALWTWEFDPNTLEFWDQPEPTALPIIRKDGRRTNQPKTADFLLLQGNFVGWVECKPRQWLEDQRRDGDVNFVCEADGRWRYLPGEQAARAWGMGYIVRVADENNPVLVDNLRMLDDFLVDDVLEVPAPERSRIVDTVSSARWLLIRDLCAMQVNVDHLYTLIARGDLYVPLETSRLSEPWMTHVYRDEECARAHQAILASENSQRVLDINVVELTPGSRLVWDGRPLQIVNVGESMFYLRSEEGGLVQLERQHIEALIGKGEIHADAGAPPACAARLKERMVRATEAEYTEALKKYAALFPQERLDDGMTHPPVPSRTMTKWRSEWREGQEVYGNGFFGLLPKIHRRGNRLPKLPPATMTIIDHVIQTKYLKPEAPTLKAAWGLIRNLCEEAGTIQPSEKTVSRAIERSFTAVELVEARQGAKQAYQIKQWYWWLEVDTPRHGQRPFEIGHIDHTEVDLQLVDPRFERKTGKCWLTVMIDAFSRMVLATYVTFDPPSYRSCMMVLRNCVRLHGRVPAMIVVDAGSDFISTYFERLLAFLNCSKTNRPKGAPRHGTLIELLFKRANVDFIHELRGNNKPLQSPRSMSPTHDPRKRAVWTIGTFTDAVNAYLDEGYANQVNENLGVSPREAFRHGISAHGAREHQRIAFDENLRMISLPSTDKGTARVRPNGYVKINKIPYSAPELNAPGLKGSDVPVRYDPFNMGLAYAQVGGKWIELKSDYFALFQRYTERQLEAASAELRDRLRASYGNRVINVKLLARHLAEVGQVEQQLVEDAEAALAHEKAQAAIAEAARRPEAGASPPVDPDLDGDVFAGLDVVDYGDIE